jgi:hypothetical protein
MSHTKFSCSLIKKQWKREIISSLKTCLSTYSKYMDSHCKCKISSTSEVYTIQCATNLSANIIIDINTSTMHGSTHHKIYNLHWKLVMSHTKLSCSLIRTQWERDYLESENMFMYIQTCSKYMGSHWKCKISSKLEVLLLCL